MIHLLKVQRVYLGLFAAAVWFGAIAGSSSTMAQEQGQFEGAIWRFSMTPRPPLRGREPLRGVFRVHNHVLYQKSIRSPDAPFDKEIGKNHPNGKKTRIEFHDLRAADRNQNFKGGLSGQVLLSFDAFGEWSGRYIDAQGLHWDFKCTRVQE